MTVSPRTSTDSKAKYLFVYVCVYLSVYMYVCIYVVVSGPVSNLWKQEAWYFQENVSCSCVCFHIFLKSRTVSLKEMKCDFAVSVHSKMQKCKNLNYFFQFFGMIVLYFCISNKLIFILLKISKLVNTGRIIANTMQNQNQLSH